MSLAVVRGRFRTVFSTHRDCETGNRQAPPRLANWQGMSSSLPYAALEDCSHSGLRDLKNFYSCLVPVSSASSETTISRSALDVSLCLAGFIVHSRIYGNPVEFPGLAAIL